jgi:hypothetical protein
MSDTRTILFTQVPHLVEREWQCMDVPLDIITENNDIANRTESIIQSIKLTIEFNPMFQDIPDVMSEHDDETNTRIDNWKRAQQAYTVLIDAMAPIVKSIAKGTYQEAIEQKSSRVSLLKQVKTRLIRRSQHVSCTESGLPTPKPSPRPETSVGPFDSVSNVSTNRSSRTATRLARSNWFGGERPKRRST